MFEVTMQYPKRAPKLLGLAAWLCPPLAQDFLRICSRWPYKSLPATRAAPATALIKIGEGDVPSAVPLNNLCG